MIISVKVSYKDIQKKDSDYKHNHEDFYIITREK